MPAWRTDFRDSFPTDDWATGTKASLANRLNLGGMAIWTAGNAPDGALGARYWQAITENYSTRDLLVSNAASSVGGTLSAAFGTEFVAKARLTSDDAQFAEAKHTIEMENAHAFR